MSLEVVNTICNVFTAIGTVGAVVVALYLACKESKPKLRVHATVGVIAPDMSEHLWLSCVNVGRQAITCTGFVFNPNRFKKTGAVRIMPLPKTEMPNLTKVSTPSLLQYSESLNQHFSHQFFDDANMRSILSRYKWIAKVQLIFFWRVVATTNVKEFNGKLSRCLVDKILSTYFPSKNQPIKKD